ncbi:histidinol-phosphate transaminase [Alkalilimnicola sp. S0819]|uniref:histidinol-phosphate transaminase n=1 Tax=Alkalilimnicola sp. S0819 TaxID=2613922 RepID=UPI001261C781|nr:histidinol-phosphate transaminase [Alkalilimnicola sp. S0819]KAB7623835.1 histidinol-phosphate transaminase [Alkalilimnicola sp. S0819]MPQ16711.1 histidinol-phosphate transaminase [Alkalilimnicola sp. S0819]
MSDQQARIGRWVRPAVQALKAYHVQPAARTIKLDAMENPYHWSEEMVDAWLARLRQVELNRYPDPAAAGLKTRLREAMGVPAESELMLGNGSDELILLLALALGGAGKTVLAPGPSFVMYRIIAAMAGLEYREVALRAEGFELNLPAMLAAMEEQPPAVVYLAYPNNPTGNLFRREDIETIIERAPGVVVVDEAYFAFAGDSFMADLTRYPQLLVMRTVSKMGLAGLRLGLLAGHPDWLAQLEKCRLPYNINVLTQASAEFALDHRAVLEEQSARIRRDREGLMSELAAIPGLQPFPSQANFIAFRVPPGRAGELHGALRERGVLVKNLHGSDPQLADCLRVTVGTPEENAAFLQALKASL